MVKIDPIKCLDPIDLSYPAICSKAMLMYGVLSRSVTHQCLTLLYLQINIVFDRVISLQLEKLF